MKKAECLVATYSANLKFCGILTLNECGFFLQIQECLVDILYISVTF